MGGKAVHYVPDTPDDVEEQVALVDRALAARPDAFVFVPVHLTAMNASILKINAAGIPLVNLISPTGVGERVCFIGSDDRALAAEVTRYVARRLPDGAKVVILEGHPASGTTHERLRGIQEALAYFPGLAVVASARGDYQRDIACEAVSGLLKQGIRFDAVIASNDTMALGALDALDRLQPGVALPPVVGVNAIPEAIAAIKAFACYGGLRRDENGVHRDGGRVPPSAWRGSAAFDHAAGAGRGCFQLRTLGSTVRRT
jgi:ribose transport system substrate-binding protein